MTAKQIGVIWTVVLIGLYLLTGGLLIYLVLFPPIYPDGGMKQINSCLVMLGSKLQEAYCAQFYATATAKAAIPAWWPFGH